MKKKIITWIGAIIFCLPNLVAQTSQSIKEAEKDLKERCLQTVNAYTYHVEYIADKNNSETVKDDHILAALEYFIGKGDGLKLLDEWGNPIMEDGAYKFEVNPPRIEITSPYRPTKRPYIKTYLRSLKTLPYEKVTISSSNAYFVSDLKQIDENVYEAVLAYCQIFKGQNGEWQVIHKDEKAVRMRITEIVVDSTKKRWKVEMGDITARLIEAK